MRHRAFLTMVVTVVLAAPADQGRAEAAAAGCTGPAAGRLDFWVGTWEVHDPSGGREGHNVIEKTLGGCAVLEHWTDADGSAGQSLFYLDRLGGRWKQVWVTDDGAFKEKAEQTDFAGGLRFQGEIPRPDGRRILDRTTLSVLPDGRVRQLIEQSADGGSTWRAWEGLYSRVAGGEAAGAGPAALPAADAEAIRALHREYRDAWLAGDAHRVMATLTTDALLLPGGHEPVQGETAIRAFWWPAGPPATIDAFEITLDEIGGAGDLAYTRGHDRLRFTTGAPGDRRTTSQASTFLDLVRRGPDGRWRIARHMWSALGEP